MCPDEELLSSFIDDEVPSPWKERIEKHLESCTKCAQKIEAYKRLAVSLGSFETQAEKTSLIEAKARISSSLVKGKIRPARSYPSILDWLQNAFRARIAIPLPFLAAGAVGLVFFAGVALGGVRILRGSSATIASSKRTIDSAQFGSEALASYIRQAQIQPVTIEMPGNATLDTYGNPVFVASEPAMIQVSTTLAGSK